MPLDGARLFLCEIAAAGFGVYRALGNHPIVRLGYRAWLRATPWQLSKPLPSGPVRWVWQDGIVIGMLVLMAFGSPEGGIGYIPIAFVLSYVVSLCVATSATGIYWPCYASAFVLGLGCMFHEYPIAQVVALGSACLVVFVGLRQSLAGFPWQGQFDEGQHRWARLMGIMAETRQRYAQKRAVGFPFCAINPRGSDWGMPYRHGLSLAFTASWILLAGLVVASPGPEKSEFCKTVLVEFPILVAFFRVVIYCSFHWPPINFPGRIITLRWILPRYDRVFLTPIAAIIGGYAVSFCAWEGLWGDQIAAPIAVFFSLAIALNGGPSLSDWALTGQHRFVPAVSSLTDCQKV